MVSALTANWFAVLAVGPLALRSRQHTRPYVSPQCSLMCFLPQQQARTSRFRPYSPLWRGQVQMDARDENDNGVIGKLFKLFFGEEEARPLGLGRTSGAPDTYPATTTEFAEPLADDGPGVRELRPLLKNSLLEFRRLQCVYDAERDGWSATAFHQRVDGKGPCIVSAKTSSGCVCGGYAARGFAGIGEYRGSIAAFLYTWPEGEPLTPERVIKLPKVGGAGLATIDVPESGPIFGADGLRIGLEPGNEKLVRSKLGPYYARRADGWPSVFGPRDNPQQASLVELKVYAGIYAEGERIPYDGAIPFAIE